jgi:hypothetical protein
LVSYPALGEEMTEKNQPEFENWEKRSLRVARDQEIERLTEIERKMPQVTEPPIPPSEEIKVNHARVGIIITSR